MIDRLRACSGGSPRSSLMLIQLEIGRLSSVAAESELRSSDKSLGPKQTQSAERTGFVICAGTFSSLAYDITAFVRASELALRPSPRPSPKGERESNGTTQFNVQSVAGTQTMKGRP